MNCLVIFTLLFCFTRSGKQADGDSDASLEVTIDTEFEQICPDLIRADFVYPTNDDAENCETQLTQYHTSLETYLRDFNDKKLKLEGSLEMIDTAIQDVSLIPTLSENDITPENIDDKLLEAKDALENLEADITSKKQTLETLETKLAKLSEEYETFKAFSMLSLSEKFYFTTLAPAIFMLVYGDKTICYKPRRISLREAYDIDPKIDPKILINFVRYLFLSDLSAAQLAQFTPPYLHSLAHSMLDEDTCNISYSTKPDRKMLMRLFLHIYKLSPEFLGHLLLSSSCHVKYSLDLKAGRIIDAIKTSKPVLEKMESRVSEYLKDKSFIFGYDSFEEIVAAAISSVVEFVDVKAFLATQKWGMAVVECKVRKSVKVFVENSLQKNEFSTAAIICIGAMIGIILMLIIYLLIRPL